MTLSAEATNTILVAENITLQKQIEIYREIIRVYEGDSLSSQSKLESRIEVASNYISGFLIAWLTWTLLIMGPFTWGWIVKENGLAITMIFTMVSVLRSYFWRRFFARNFHKVVQQFYRENTGW